MRLVVGLGNPGPSYEETRHNVGRDFVSFLGQSHSQKFSKQRQADVLRLPSFFAARLSCFMNESGYPIKMLLSEQKLTPADLLVIVDDFMIPFGTLRLRPGGSSGGHNGLKSIIEHLATDQFSRLRVGVGPVPSGEDPADFVLERFNKTELAATPLLYKAIDETIFKLDAEGIEKAMNWTNKSHLQ